MPKSSPPSGKDGIKWKPFANMNEQNGLWAVILLFKSQEQKLGRILRPQKPGRKAKSK